MISEYYLTFIDQMKQATVFNRILFLLIVLVVSTVMTLISIEIDWRLKFRKWFYISVSTTLILICNTIFHFWIIFEFSLVWKILLAIALLALMAIVYILSLMIVTLMGQRSVPAQS